MSRLNILLGTFSEANQRYLDRCLDSLNCQTMRDFTVILGSSGQYTPHFKSLDSDIRVKHDHTDYRRHFPEVIHSLGKQLDSDCTHILILNDDVILNSRCIESMFVGFNPKLIVNPASNCDNARAFFVNFGPFPGSPQYKFDDVSDHMASQIITDPFRFPQLYIFRDWVAFYCTLMTRAMYEDVGGIDPTYKTGKDDLDFCMRARDRGGVPTIAMHAYAFHFSGVTADVHLTIEDRNFNEKYFCEKFKI